MKTAQEIDGMVGKIMIPPYSGWNPAGCVEPSHQHLPRLVLEEMTFPEPIGDDDTVVLNGSTFKVEPDKDQTMDDDGSCEVPCTLRLV